VLAQAGVNGHWVRLAPGKGREGLHFSKKVERGVQTGAHTMDQSFLVLFFKKEPLSSNRAS
jgi:hypothetical protein